MRLQSHLLEDKIIFPLENVKFILAIALLEVTAFIAYGIGVATQKSTIIAPLASLSPAVTILLALIFLKEKIEINQKVGIAAALIGIVLLSL